jgi:hypothetical protein
MLKHFKFPLKPPAKALVFSIFLLLSVFSSWQCFELPKSPVAPTWDTQLSVPIVDSLYRISEAAASNPAIVTIDPGYSYKPSRFLFDPADIGSHLKLTPQMETKNFKHTIGDLTINLPELFGINCNASDIIPFSLPYSGPVGEIASTALPASVASISTTEYNFIHFQSGTLTLQLANTFPVPLDFPNGITISNTGSGDIVASFDPITVPANSTQQVQASTALSGVTMTNSLTFAGNYHSAGSGGNSVTISSDNYLSMNLGLHDGLADSARAKIAIRVNQDTTFSQYIIDSLTLVKLVTFNSGKLQLNFQNTIAVNLLVQFKIDDLLDKLGNPFVYEQTLTPYSQSIDVPIDLQDYSIQSLSGDLINKLHFGFSIKTDTLPTNNSITIHSSDFISGSITATEMPFVVKEVHGVSSPLSYNITDTVDVPLGRIPYNFTADSLAIDSLTLILHINAPGHTTYTSTQLLGINASDQVVASFTIPANTNWNGNNWREVVPDEDYTITLDAASGNGTFLANFLTKKADRIVIVHSGIINPEPVYNQTPHQIGIIYDTSHVYIGLDVDFPLKAGIFNGSLTDTLEISNTSSDGTLIDHDILSSIKQATIYLSVENTVSCGVSLQLNFLDQFGNSLLQLPIAGQDSIWIAPGPSQTATPIAVRIQTEDALKFNDAQKVVLKITLNSGAQPTEFSTTDYVHVKAYSNMVFNVDPDKLKNK